MTDPIKRWGMSKTVRELLARHYPPTSFPEDGWPLLDYPVIEPSGVVLAVDREKLLDALDNAITRKSLHTVDLKWSWVEAGVDAILTSLAEGGFREVEVLDGRFKVELLADGRFAIVQVEDEGAQVALIKGETLFHKPHPPAKED